MAVPYLTRALAYRLSPAARRSSPRLVSWSAVAGVSGFESCAEYADEGYGGDEWLDRVQGDVGDVADVGHVRDADLTRRCSINVEGVVPHVKLLAKPAPRASGILLAMNLILGCRLRPVRRVGSGSCLSR